MAKTGYKHLLPRLPAHDSQAWALHDRLAKRAADERAAADATRKADAERKVAAEAANESDRAAAAEKARKDAAETRQYFGIRNLFD